jgi:hypothetical protein
MSRWTLIAAAGLMLCAAPLSAQYIGIFQDASATSCAAAPGPAPWIDLHVVAVLEGGVPEGTGAQFSITGAPEGWASQNALWVPALDATVSLGHPLFANPSHDDQPGVNVAFGTCQTGHVPLGRIVLLGAPTPGNVRLRVDVVQLSPSDPDCPFIVDCDAPVFAKHCVGGGEFVLNGTAPASCQVAVAPATWTGVKALYH